jgi:hypothetical protein
MSPVIIYLIVDFSKQYWISGILLLEIIGEQIAQVWFLCPLLLVTISPLHINLQYHRIQKSAIALTRQFIITFFVSKLEAIPYVSVG